VKCSVSLWSADLSALGNSIDLLENYVDGFHLDVMDGIAVPNLLFGPDFISAVRRRTIPVRMDWHEGFQIYAENGSVIGTDLSKKRSKKELPKRPPLVCIGENDKTNCFVAGAGRDALPRVRRSTSRRFFLPLCIRALALSGLRLLFASFSGMLFCPRRPIPTVFSQVLIWRDRKGQISYCYSQSDASTVLTIDTCQP
jgi:hypothetical protein